MGKRTIMKPLFALLTLSVFLWTACDSAETNTTGDDAAATDTTAAVQEENPSTGTFGAEISDEGAMPVANLLAEMGDQDSMEVKLVGTVNEVCQMKGCWMTMDLGQGQEMMVKFKDYEFFVPMDCAGKEAVMQGYAKRSLIPVDELKHYAEDAGKSEEEIAMITEPEEKITFLAEGVIIR